LVEINRARLTLITDQMLYNKTMSNSICLALPQDPEITKGNNSRSQKIVTADNEAWRVQLFQLFFEELVSTLHDLQD
jgi:hypothetical protein